MARRPRRIPNRKKAKRTGARNRRPHMTLGKGIIHGRDWSREGLISRDEFFNPPGMRELKMSHDGTRISFIAAVEGIENVCVAPVRNPKAALSVTSVKPPDSIDSHRWTYNPRYLLYTSSFMHDENYRVSGAYLGGDNNVRTRLLTPQEGVQARIQLTSPLRPDEVLVCLNDRDPVYHDVYRINFITGEKELQQINDIGAADFFFDNDFNTRFARKINSDGSISVLAPNGSGGWDKAMELPPEDALMSHFLNFDITGRYAYLSDSRGRDTIALKELDTETFRERILASAPDSDLADYTFHPSTGVAYGAAFERERFRWEAVDPAMRRDIQVFRAFNDLHPSILARATDDRKWVVEYTLSDGPKLHYLYDRDERSMRLIFPSEPHLLELELARMRSTTIRARDGLNLVAYYTLPRDVRGRRPRKPLPAVLFVHGGPWSRDRWGYDDFHQVLANRGYAVISVNFRGSTGLGKKFLNAGNMEWGGKMHDDLLDTVDWAVKNKIADKDRIAIMGASYGGYAALVGLTFTPDVFACGIDMFGPSDLSAFLESAPTYWGASDDVFKNRMGDHATEEGREFLRSRSPLYRVGEITKPLLIAQGGNDPRVARSESDRIVDAMKERGIPVIYLLFPTAGHGMGGSHALMAVIEDFLKKHIGGEAEPITEDTFLGSSMRILDGVELITGAEAAVKAQRRYNDEQIEDILKRGGIPRLLPERVRSGRL